MTSKERVAAVIQRRSVDRVPLFIWFHPETTLKLARELEIEPDQVESVFANDVWQRWVNNNYSMEGIVHSTDGEGHTDQWGIEWVRSYGFNQIARHPLQGRGPASVLDYSFPVDSLDELMTPMALASDPDLYIGCDVSPCAFEMYWRIRGMTDALLDFADDEPLAEEMISRSVDFSIELANRAIENSTLDWLWTGDDVASQSGMIISPDQWRRIVKPHLKRLFRLGKKSGLPIAYHCCGALRPIIPDLIEIGCDVLNPIQAGCPGMEPESLKADFGSDLTFMGGLDTQHLMPLGRVIDVERATEGLIETMSRDGGGFILAASHSIPPETPTDNIFAMYRAAGLSREEISDRAADSRRVSS